MVFVVSGSGGRSRSVVFIQLSLKDELPVRILRMDDASQPTSPDVRCCTLLHRVGSRLVLEYISQFALFFPHRMK